MPLKSELFRCITFTILGNSFCEQTVISLGLHHNSLFIVQKCGFFSRIKKLHDDLDYLEKQKYFTENPQGNYRNDLLSTMELFASCETCKIVTSDLSGNY